MNNCNQNDKKILERNWTRLSYDELSKKSFYYSRNSFYCDYKEVMPSKNVVLKMAQIIKNYCEEKLKIKVANQENSFNINVITNKNKDVVGYEINVNEGIRNAKEYPYQVFTFNSFAVKRGKDKNNSDNLFLSKKLRQLQQQENPYYYIYLANFVLSCVLPNALKKSNVSPNKVLEPYGLKYKNEFYNTKALKVDKILFDKNYFNDNQIEEEKS